MAVIIPQWAIGKHITSILLVPQAVSTTDGTLSDTTPTRQFFGHLQEVEVDVQFEFENISAMDRPFANKVPIEQSQNLRLTEYEAFVATGGAGTNNLAAAAAFGATYWKYTVIRGPQTFVGYGVLGSYKMSGTKPKVTATLELEAIDTGTATAPITYS